MLVLDLVAVFYGYLLLMLLRKFSYRPSKPLIRLTQMATHVTNTAIKPDSRGETTAGFSLRDLPKSHVFTSSLPPDPQYPLPVDSHKAPRRGLGPRQVKGALYTFVRPEGSDEPELLSVSKAALRDIGLKEEEAKSDEFKELVAGNKLLEWDEETGEGLYPWAQCYGGKSYILACANTEDEEAN